MKKVIVIGGTGHIGRFLTPMLVKAGYEVIVITRGQTTLLEVDAWKSVKLVNANYRRDDSGWQDILAGIKAEVIIDIIGADLGSLYNTARDHCQHLIACGSVWMFGEPKVVPTPDETQGPCRFEGYAWRYAEMLKVKEQAVKDGICFSAIMPPNICGPGKIPLETMGGRDIEVHRALKEGKQVTLPAPGSTLVGPCDAEDIANAFVLAVNNRDAANGEIFNVGSAYALTTKQLVHTYGRIYGVDIPVHWVDWQEYITDISPSSGAYSHFEYNMCPDITKIRHKLGYQPKYTSEETLSRAVDWMKEQKLI